MVFARVPEIESFEAACDLARRLLKTRRGFVVSSLGCWHDAPLAVKGRMLKGIQLLSQNGSR